MTQPLRDNSPASVSRDNSGPGSANGAATGPDAASRLADGLAHDLNNLLGGLLGVASLLRQKAVAQPDLQPLASALNDASQRGLDLVTLLQGFAACGGDAAPSLDLAAAATASLAMLPPDVTLRSASTSPATARIAPEELRQIIASLLGTASAQMPEGIRLDIETGTYDACDAPGLAPDVSARSLAYLRLCARQERRTDRHVLSDAASSPVLHPEAGLNWAVARVLVDRLGGRLVSAADSAGTITYTVILPALPGELPVAVTSVQQSTPAAPTQSVIGTKKVHAPTVRGVIVALDAAIPRHQLADSLTLLGQAPVFDCDTRDVAEVLRTHRDAVSLLVLGVDLAAPPLPSQLGILRSQRPGLRIILAGDAANARLDDLAARLGAVGILPLPLDLSRLENLLACLT